MGGELWRFWAGNFLPILLPSLQMHLVVYDIHCGFLKT